MGYTFLESYPFSVVSKNWFFSTFHEKMNFWFWEIRKMLFCWVELIKLEFSFHLFSSSFFCFPSQKIQTHFGYTSAGTLRSRISTLRECQNAQLVLIFLDVATHFLQKYKVQFFNLGLKQTEPSYSWKCVPLENSSESAWIGKRWNCH